MLLARNDDPARFVERPPLADVLAKWSREDLAALIERMVQRYPDLERLVELPVPVVDAGGSANELSVDPALIRRLARTAFAEGDSYSDDPFSDDFDFDDDYGSGGLVPGAADVHALLDLGERYAAAGQWANAQVVFTCLAEETGETILSFPNDEGQLSNVVTECDAVLSACLAAQAELPESERPEDELRQRLIRALYDIWRFDVFEADGMELAQNGPAAIARYVTGEERAVVEGWLREEEPNDRQENYVTGFQVVLRENSGLNDEELLSLYREVGFWADVAQLLPRLDRVDEAVAVAGRRLDDSITLIGFAIILIERGGAGIDRALRLVDDRAWEVEGVNPIHDAELQKWLVGQFSLHDRPRQALAMAERRFKRQPHRWRRGSQSGRLPSFQVSRWTPGPVFDRGMTATCGPRRSGRCWSMSTWRWTRSRRRWRRSP